MYQLQCLSFSRILQNFTPEAKPPHGLVPSLAIHLQQKSYISRFMQQCCTRKVMGWIVQPNVEGDSSDLKKIKYPISNEIHYIQVSQVLDVESVEAQRTC